MTDAQEKAAAAAVKLLAQALLDPNSAMAQMAKALNREEAQSNRPKAFDPDRMNKFMPPDDGKKDGKDGVFAKAMDLFSGRLLAVLGPLAILGGILSSAGSGFQVLISSMNLLIAVLAPVLLPIFVVLAVAIAELAMKIREHMKGAVGDFAAFMIDKVLPVLVTLAQVVGGVIGHLISFGAALVKAADGLLTWAGDVGDDIDEAIGLSDGVDRLVGAAEDIADGVVGGAPGSTAFDIFKSAMAAAKPSPTGAGEFGGEVATGGGFDADPPGEFSGGGDFGKTRAPKLPADVAAKVAEGKAAAADGKIDLLAAVIKSLELSIGPKAQISSISQAYKNAQLAAINADPLDQLAKRAILQCVQELKQVVANTKDGGVGH
jgi:hypothetical protein